MKQNTLTAKIKAATLGLLTRTAKGIVSFVSNLLPSPTPKEGGVRPVPKTSRFGAIFQTAGLGANHLTRKRLGLIAITFLLVMGILLMPIRVTQNEAKAAEPVTTSVIVVATLYVVHTCVRWAIGRTLDAATKRDLAANGGITPTDAIARAKVNGAHWVSNSYENTYKLEDWDSSTHQSLGTWTTETESASQGDFKLTNPTGREKDGTAMSDSRARSLLRTMGKYSVKTVTYEMFTTDYDPKQRYANELPYDGYWDDVVVTARADALEQEKAKALKQQKEDHDDDTLYFGTGYEIDTTTYNVGDFKMESFFDDAGWAVLGHKSADEKEANDYEGKLYWKYQEVLEDGSLGEEKDDHEFFRFLSYTYSNDSHTACGDNQVITEIHISDDIRRWFENKTIMGWKFIFQGNSATGVPIYVTQWVPVMMHRIVRHEDNEYETVTIL